MFPRECVRDVDAAARAAGRPWPGRCGTKSISDHCGRAQQPTPDQARWNHPIPSDLRVHGVPGMSARAARGRTRARDPGRHRTTAPASTRCRSTSPRPGTLHGPVRGDLGVSAWDLQRRWLRAVAARRRPRTAGAAKSAPDAPAAEAVNDAADGPDTAVAGSPRAWSASWSGRWSPPSVSAQRIDNVKGPAHGSRCGPALPGQAVPVRRSRSSCPPGGPGSAAARASSIVCLPHAHQPVLHVLHVLEARPLSAYEEVVVDDGQVLGLDGRENQDICPCERHSPWRRKTPPTAPPLRHPQEATPPQVRLGSPL